jgi:microcystin-dependent protein
MDVFIGCLLSCSWQYQTKGFAFCNGQLMPINQNQALFSLLGTVFGGNGVSTFGLPNLQGRTPIGFGNGSGLSPYVLGQVGGEAAHTLALGEMPQHAHTLSGNSATAGTDKITGNSPAVSPAGTPIYGPSAGLALMNPASISKTGGNQPHENRQPFLVINWVIALNGIFPSRN